MIQKSPAREKPTGNRLFLIFALLTFVVAGINLQFHHHFHDEYVVDKARRQFQKHFKTSQHEEATGDPVLRRSSATNEEQRRVKNLVIRQSTETKEGHRLAGLQCEEKYGGPEDGYAEKEMAFWSDIPSDASYKSPFMVMDETERFLTFEP